MHGSNRQQLILVAPIEGLSLAGSTSWPAPNALQLHGGPDSLADFLGEVCSEPDKLRTSMIDGLGSRDTRALLARTVFFAQVLIAPAVPTAELREVIYERRCLDHLDEIRSFLLGLWMVRDFSFELPNAYLLGPAAAFRYASFRGLVTDSCAGMNTTSFSADEVAEAQAFSERLNRLSLQSVQPRPSAGPVTQQPRPTVCTANKPRLHKALLWLFEARLMPDLAVRIAHYCASLEALFSSSRSEITHQLAERVAWFVEPSRDERALVYDKVKEAYDVRCDILHGTFVSPPKTAALASISTDCDELLRKVLRRIAEHPENASLFTKDDDKEFKRYFKEKVLGVLE